MPSLQTTIRSHVWILGIFRQRATCITHPLPCPSDGEATRIQSSGDLCCCVACFMDCKPSLLSQFSPCSTLQDASPLADLIGTARVSVLHGACQREICVGIVQMLCGSMPVPRHCEGSESRTLSGSPEHGFKTKFLTTWHEIVC